MPSACGKDHGKVAFSFSSKTGAKKKSEAKTKYCIHFCLGKSLVKLKPLINSLNLVKNKNFYRPDLL